MRAFVLAMAFASAWAGSQFFAAPAVAHPGGLNSEGCHNNRKTGDHHCHRGPSANPHPARANAATSGREFANCSQARAVGAAPVHASDPGYGRHLDRDGDGVGCE